MKIVEVLRRYRRTANAVAALVCFALVGYAIHSQTANGLDPCPLCIFQRIGVTAMGVAFLVAALLPARPAAWAWTACALTTLGCGTTAGIAARHVYIQSLPPGTVPACGATLDYMFEIFPVMEVLKKVLTGSGECAKIDWTFLGISMPGWVLIWALALAIAGLVINWPRRPTGAWPAA